MKILVITSAYGLTGVPLAQIRFARALAARGHDVELVIGRIPEEYKFDPPAELKTTVWHKQKTRAMFGKIAQYLRREKPDVVFSAEDHLNTLVLFAAILTGSKAKISGSCRVTPFDTYSNKPFSKRWVLKYLARLVMKRADALTCVSKDMVQQYRQVFNNPPHECVYNIVDDARSRARLSEPVEHPWLDDKQTPVLIAAGRLAPWKGFTDLIGAVAMLKDRRAFRLIILGDGPQRQELQEMIDRHGLGDRVELAGYVENPLKYFKKADVFVLSSLVEGMPNVLVEAMMAGCTPVSTDCPTGPRELLHGTKYGYLSPVGDRAALADAILYALDNPIDEALLDDAIAPFREDAVIDRHFEILGLSD